MATPGKTFQCVSIDERRGTVSVGAHHTNKKFALKRAKDSANGNRTNLHGSTRIELHTVLDGVSTTTENYIYRQHFGRMCWLNEDTSNDGCVDSKAVV